MKVDTEAVLHEEGRGLTLRVAGFVLRVNGVDGQQDDAIACTFGAHVVSGPVSAKQVARGFCRIRWLDDPSALPSRASLLRDGRYTPRLSGNAGLKEIAGLDFRATIASTAFAHPPPDSGPLETTLWVHPDHDWHRPGALDSLLRFLLAYFALQRGGVLLHCSGVVHRGSAFVFTARGNTGKTTLACKGENAGAAVLSDDLNVVARDGDAVTAQLVPRSGEFGRRAVPPVDPGAVPLGALILLEQAPALTAARVTSPAEAVAGLITGCPYVNTDPDELPRLVEVLTDLVALVPVVRLGVSLEDSFEDMMRAVLKQVENG